MEDEMTKKKKTLEQKMLQANVLLANIMLEPFQSALKEYGYNEARFSEGHQLYEEAETLIRKRNMAFMAQIKATRLLNKKQKEASDYFTEKAILARKALKNNPGFIKDLGISGRKKESYAGWTGDARNFYNIAPSIPEVMISLEKFGITVESLKKGLTLIEEIDPFYTDQKDKMGMAQVTTPGRNKKTKALFSWISDVITCARMAFKDDLQQLERLGITVYSKGYRPAAGPAITENGDRQETGKEKVEPQMTTRTQREEFWFQKDAVLEKQEKITPHREWISSPLPDGVAGEEGQNNLIEFFPEHWGKGDRIKQVIA
jgi:hypothetical protein